MLSKITSAIVHGIEPMKIEIETDVSKGLPALNIVGLGDTTVKESGERIRGAIINSGFNFPKSRITVNMSPAWLKKKGSHLDLAIAIGILASSGQIHMGDLTQCCFIGELSLDGKINTTEGILPIVMAVYKKGINKVFIPKDNYSEAALFEKIEIIPVSTLKEVVQRINSENYSVDNNVYIDNNSFLDFSIPSNKDFSDVKGQEFAKRAILIAVAGGHGILMSGSPGTGKSMLAERIPDIMPPLSFDEVLELTSLYSASGALNKDIPIVFRRPFRSPSTSITKMGLFGGGNYPKPGEITLAHKGVLFLDELAEMDRNIIDGLRVPLEEKKISIKRQGEEYSFPADFLLVAATNPCKCGYYGDPTHQCICTRNQIINYQGKISGPILDRIDIHINLQPVAYKELSTQESMSTKQMKNTILKARKLQYERYKKDNIILNSQLNNQLVEKYCMLNEQCTTLMSSAYEKLNLNPRGVFKIIKIARTIADIEDSKDIQVEHLSEALQYRDKILRA